MLLALVSALVAAPRAAQAADDPKVGESAIVTGTDGAGLRVRAGPAMSHRVLTTAREGAIVQVISGPVSDGDEDWYQISYGSATTGWGVGRYLVPSSAVRSLTTGDGPRTFVAKITAYSDGIGGIPMGARTFSGTRTRFGVVAVDPKFIPLGSALTIEGYDGTIFIAEDTGGAIKGPTIDIWLPDQKEARTYGTQYRRVTVVREGPPK